MLKISNSNSDEIRVFRKVFEHTGKLVCAKKTLMKLALNNYLNNKLGDNMEEFLSDSKGLQCGILFTDLDSKDVLEAISNFGSQNYAQVGEVSTKAIEISNEDLEHFPSSIQPYLEKIGVEVEVNNGKVEILGEKIIVCNEGETITTNQSKILRCLNKKISSSKMELSGSFEIPNSC